MLDGWLEVKRLIEEDVEEATGYRRLGCPIEPMPLARTETSFHRYIGLRWSAPRPRKVTTRKSVKQTDSRPDGDEEDDDDVKQVLKPSMKLSGFVGGEWDIKGGTF